MRKRSILIGIAILIVVSWAAAYSVGFYEVPTNSMSPTVTKEDRLMAFKYAYWNSNPERGDLVLFKHPVTGNIHVKRVAGLPGERVQIENGTLLINGKALSETSILNEFKYYTRDDWAYGKEGQIIEIPEDSLFVTGDFSAQSSDSRHWGFVPIEDVVGEAVLAFRKPFSKIRFLK